ncbi:transketolase family protein [Nonomuraea diastatica]|uniref:Transketolase n=1 Tax=Nonomuraea diastatica TaxID=1848329 RepID=A0A4R4WXX2_9ACTN|nr:transketolase C-terminal domain-containing protein [Nonomuraea diastatica]TDD22601.1 transketolase [Nonomuraea diastatica]
MSETASRSSREVYRDLVAELLPRDERLVCLDSDTGLFGGVDFGTARDRYVNLGIAEHTMMGTAAGLAKEGRRPLVNTMAAFAASRAVEAVKIDIAMNHLPVVIAATHSGVSAGHLGPTHHALEDLAVMRTLPNMTVVAPGDAATTETLFRQALSVPGPVYFRLGRGPTPDLPQGPPVRLGRAQVLRRGLDVTIAACGPYPVLAALEAADRLGRDGIRASVLHVHTVKPLDVATLAAWASATGVVITVEEHWASAGFGAAVAESLTELMPIRMHRVALPDAFVSVAGDQRHLLRRAGVTASAVVERARAALGQKDV